ncbi:hypothetical protein [Hoeflea sp.]|uniref:hypothetical protein n=1 Tax=Hoeflea sp. TaxID=1940281 RepID=UPI003B0239C6
MLLLRFVLRHFMLRHFPLRHFPLRKRLFHGTAHLFGHALPRVGLRRRRVALLPCGLLPVATIERINARLKIGNRLIEHING